MTPNKRDSRRLTGSIALAIALTLLIAGQTFLKSYLTGFLYIGYWLVCIVATFLALIVAFLDLRRVRDQSRDQQRELIEKTLENLPEAARRNQTKGRPGSRERRE